MSIEKLNTIKNTKLIPLDSCFLVLCEEKEELQENPVSDYYSKIDDFSINLYISLK